MLLHNLQCYPVKHFPLDVWWLIVQTNELPNRKSGFVTVIVSVGVFMWRDVVKIFIWLELVGVIWVDSGCSREVIGGVKCESSFFGFFDSPCKYSSQARYLRVLKDISLFLTTPHCRSYSEKLRTVLPIYSPLNFRNFPETKLFP